MKPRTHRFPLPAGTPAIDVRNPSGSVTVEALDAADELTVLIEPRDGAAEQALERVEVSLVGSRLRIAVPERRLFRSPSFAITVTTPPGASARVAVASADAELRGPLGRVELTGASGDADVEECAELQFRTASGDARIGAVDGRVTVGSASGDIRVERAGGGLVARTASGDIAVGEAAGDVSLTTASGDLTVGRIAEGAVQVKTVSGDAEIGVAPGLRIWLDLSSVSGRMDSQLDDDCAPEGGPAQLSVTMRSVSGDLRIRRVAVAE